MAQSPWRANQPTSVFWPRDVWDPAPRYYRHCCAQNRPKTVQMGHLARRSSCNVTWWSPTLPSLWGPEASQTDPPATRDHLGASGRNIPEPPGGLRSRTMASCTGRTSWSKGLSKPQRRGILLFGRQTYCTSLATSS